ncbi:MAG: hypothetical protein A2X61_06410 [Ignavibacteria bacterium GWB2_35_12]|nr:MAG: hypothetical protein A2X61_06410 [Ignavibacteria bacterium GWB2_35_12]OGU95888.1 MAG: hypothetical protein A2220_03515 [Ignavibacteria bacterium RIFOXYA2_FULL_35_10]OGV20660.1 MAG: hypothetical protein A2475_03650 [Ignavibacteria bacterium RIFOXYC2_FULL_35_21]
METPYREAMSYINKARLALRLAGKEDKFYIDEKYVKSACGIAYSGMLKALDFLFDIKGVPKRRGRKSIFYYQVILSEMDKKLLKHLNNGYEVLHLYGYYDGGSKIQTVESGVEDALSIITALKPYSGNGRK